MLKKNMGLNNNYQASNTIIAVGVFLDDAWLDSSQAPPMNYHLVTCLNEKGIIFERNYGRGEHALEKANREALNIALENRSNLKLFPSLTKDFLAVDPRYIKHMDADVGSNNLIISFFDASSSCLNFKSKIRYISPNSFNALKEAQLRINHDVCGINALPEVTKALSQKGNVIHLP